MLYYCTLFDSNYISKGIALYLSLERHTDHFLLYLMAMDRKCEKMLKNMDFAHMHVECIEDIETGSLLEAKQNRSRAEYCWTCGSVVTEHFFRTRMLPEITYLDSDLMFFCSPKCVDNELKKANASVGLTPHFINNTIFGVYCVQYVYFKRDEDGEKCLNWWKNECLKWCYSKLEDGKYGDQKYLDYMKNMFSNVYAIENRGVGIANWNIEQYDYHFNEGFLIHQGRRWPIVFFHYNGVNVKVENGKLVFVYSKYLTKVVVETFIKQYAELLTFVYINYLGIKIDGFEMYPQNKVKVFLNGLWLYVRGNKIAMRLEQKFMEHKYIQRVSPYSERKNR